MPDNEITADAGVVAAIEWAIICVDAWLRVQEAKRANAVPSRKTAQDASAAGVALARAAQLAGTAPADGHPHEARKSAAETFRDEFHKNEVAAERGDLDALAKILGAVDEIRRRAGEWR
jgi:hypothetical protein